MSTEINKILIVTTHYKIEIYLFRKANSMGEVGEDYYTLKDNIIHRYTYQLIYICIYKYL